MSRAELQAGQECDALIALNVMGWNVCDTADGGKAGIAPGQSYSAVRIPAYSTDIAASWKIVEFLRKEGFDFDSFSSATRLQAGWSDVVFMSQVDEYSARAETLPLAICQAALLAVSK